MSRAKSKGGARMRELRARYDEWTAAHPRAKEDFAGAIGELLSDAGLAFDSVTARVKTWRSLRIKANRRRDDGEFAYPDPWPDVHDIIGVRVTTYHSNEIPDVLAVLGDSLEVVRTIDKTAETRISGQFGYGSHHLVCRVGEGAPPGLAPYKGQQFEVQVRTVLQHAWAEFEHDIRYKSPEGAIDPRIDRAFALAAGLIELADQQFDQVAAILDEEHGPDADAVDGGGEDEAADAVEFGAETLPGLLTLLLPTVPRSKSEHYAWLEELLDANGVTTVGDLRDLVAPDRVAAVEDVLKYRFQPGHVRIIDDLLLAAFGAEHVERTGSSGAHPAQRPARLRSRLGQMRKAGVVG
ncbi:GTP pyrophosphokinase family protein [uncultured Corynebacterium sp.]|uniref:GTP pyrophosphokinase n=1 Tax=uncultured Corynebacterium sp. TaxID=159447 RepID=UPI0025DD633B|nr:GTP pyrophosphokinase family protein [uncultured Corynebacterium sp.]